MTVSDTAESGGSAADGTLPSAVTCSVKDGATCQDMLLATEINTANMSDSSDIVVSTSSEHPTMSTFTQSMVCCAEVIT